MSQVPEDSLKYSCAFISVCLLYFIIFLKFCCSDKIFLFHNRVEINDQFLKYYKIFFPNRRGKCIFSTQIANKHRVSNCYQHGSILWLHMSPLRLNKSFSDQRFVFCATFLTKLKIVNFRKCGFVSWSLIITIMTCLFEAEFIWSTKIITIWQKIHVFFRFPLFSPCWLCNQEMMLYTC